YVGPRWGGTRGVRQALLRRGRRYENRGAGRPETHVTSPSLADTRQRAAYREWALTVHDHQSVQRGSRRTRASDSTAFREQERARHPAHHPFKMRKRHLTRVTPYISSRYVWPRCH